jgi:hypothetical protein
MSLTESESYLLNELKNPRILAYVYEYILFHESAKTIDELSEETALSAKILTEEILPALNILNMIQKIKETYRAVTPPILSNNLWGIDLQNRSAITILNRLAEKSRVQQTWGKQAVYFLTYRFLVEKKYKLFNPTDALLSERLNEWFGENGYNPRTTKDSQILMNPQKLDNFAKLTSFCGITLGIGNGDYLVSVDPDLFLDLMRLRQRIIKGENTPINLFVRWLDTNFLPIYQGILESSDVIPSPYSDALATLQDQGRIELITWGDYARYKIFEPKTSTIPTTFNAYRCLV